MRIMLALRIVTISIVQVEILYPHHRKLEADLEDD